MSKFQLPSCFKWRSIVAWSESSTVTTTTKTVMPATGTAGRSGEEEQPILLDDAVPRQSSSSSGSSDLAYVDNLDVEPFPEKDARFEDEPRMEYGDGFEDDDEARGFMSNQRTPKPVRRSNGVLIFLLVVTAFAAVVGVFSASRFTAPTYYKKSGRQHITMDHIFNGTFYAQSKQLNWVPEARDGVFSHSNMNGDIILEDVRTMGEQTVLVNASNVLDSKGERLAWQGWQLSADMQYVLIKTDAVKQWRHSSFGNYWIHRISDGTTHPLHATSNPATISYCTWSPLSHSIAYVTGNDVYVLPADQIDAATPEAIRVTEDGAPSIFNGVPDWVYEEEVFSADFALWWNPLGDTIAYLRSDETKVKDFKLEYYNPSEDAFKVNPYLTELVMKYPKPGTPNPLVTAHTFSLKDFATSESLVSAKKSLSWQGSMPLESRVIMEVAWVGNDSLLIKEVDRAARVGNVVLFQDGDSTGTVVRTLGKNGEEGDDGWIDHNQNAIPVPGGYLDIVPNADGFDHIAYFGPLTSSDPVWVTNGDWEVAGGVAGVDILNGKVYFLAANPSTDRHLYSAALPNETAVEQGFEPELSAITDITRPGYFGVSFSPGGGYYVLSYRGPDVPYQKLHQSRPAVEDEKVLDVTLEDNAALNETMSKFMSPLITRTTIESDGYELNVQEMLPPNFDVSGRKKYPVLFRVYGGPGSQTVSSAFNRDWHHYLACERKYIIVTVDGRGTGFKGRKLRNPVMDNLGHYEVMDQVAVAREWAKRRYVDKKRMGIWGWSYGGYMTSKTIEADSGIFTLGMAVAPVTNWLYYDSIYTERYMSTPEANPEGYVSSAVNNVTAFGKADFLFAHGSGDDNVHYANTASLLDKLTQQQVRGWRFRMFTDSDHNISKRGAYRELFEWMTAFLEEKWGTGGVARKW